MTAGLRDPLILLVEDDPGLAAMVIDWFSVRHYSICHVDSAGDAELAIGHVQPNVIVLDLMLPDGNGLTVCSHLKRRAGAPLIICSATRRKDDAVIGLQLGADDFLRKPFSLDELQARVDLALRRPSSANLVAPGATVALQHEVGSLTIDEARCIATTDGDSLQLTPTEFRLLALLAARAPQVVSRQELADHVWGAVDEGVIHSLDVHMRRLRTKLVAAAPRVRLTTRRGFGYQLCDADTVPSP